MLFRCYKKYMYVCMYIYVKLIYMYIRFNFVIFKDLIASFEITHFLYTN